MRRMKCFFPFQHQNKKEKFSNKKTFKSWPSSASGSNRSQQKAVSENALSTSGTGFSSEKHSQTTTSSETSYSLSSPSNNPVVGHKLNELRVFKLSELKVATKNYSVDNFLGEGGFGRVYRGWIKQKDSEGKLLKVEVAVKRLNSRSHQGHKEWLSEVKYLGLVNHPNLVKLVGYCVEDDASGVQLLLVYEYMPNKSLDAHLFGTGLPALTWETRLQIILGTAQGLLYLHDEFEFQIIYRDFKSSNVLLDNNFIPKLSDFGLARQGPEIGATHVTTEVVGTMGYAAPEYVHTGHLTSKSDVWGFGIVLLELLTGRRALNNNLPKNEQWLLDWVKPCIGEPRKLHKFMDPKLPGNYPLNSAEKAFSLACQCVLKNPKERPTMAAIVSALRQIGEPSPETSSVRSNECERGELEVVKAKDRPSLKPREKYDSLKEEMTLRMKRERPLWQKLAKPTMITTW